MGTYVLDKGIGMEEPSKRERSDQMDKGDKEDDQEKQN